MKQKERKQQSYQKKMWIRKKDRERKAAKKAASKQESKPPPCSSPFSNRKTEQNITSKVRQCMPKSPTKYIQVLHNLERRVNTGKPKVMDSLDTVNDLAPTKKIKHAEVLNNLDNDNGSPSKQKAMDSLNDLAPPGKQRKVEKPKEKLVSFTLHAYGKRLAARLMKRSLSRKSRIDVSEIQKFYLREDISRILPQKRFATKDGPGYAMQVSVTAAHAKYNFENPNKKVSLGKFAALRKRNVRLMSNSHRDYCCCTYCTNIRFKVLTLSRAMPNTQRKKTNEDDIVEILLCPKSSNEQFHDPKCINAECEKCSDYTNTLNKYCNDIPEDKVLTWNTWKKEVSNNMGNMRRVVVTEKGNKAKLIQEMVDTDIKKPAQGYNFFQHRFTAQWQSLQYKEIKSRLPNNEILQVMDFAKNREIKYQSEIKSHFYTCSQVTMHPIVSFYNSEEGLVRLSSIIISEDLNHDYHAVSHYQKIVNEDIQSRMGKLPERTVIFSDGCSAQYKSRGPFADIAGHDGKLNRNYFGSEHGKNECDGEIGVLNRALDRAIIGNKAVMNSAKDIFNYCNENLQLNEVLSKRQYFLVCNGEIDRNRPQTEVKTVQNTRKFHQIINTEDKSVIKVRSLSCFCKSCEEDDSQCLNNKFVESFAQRSLQRREEGGKDGDAVQAENAGKREMTKQRGKTEKVENMGKTEKVKKIEKTEPIRKTEKIGKTEKIERTENTEHYGKTEKVRKIEKIGETEEIGKMENMGCQSRLDYFDKLLEKLSRCETYEELKTIVPSLDAEMKSLYGKLTLDPTVNAIDNKLNADKLANKLTFDNLPIEATGKLPACVIGDGNCLPRAGSVLAFGHENHFKEIRCRIAMELILNEEQYLDNKYLQRGIDIPQNESNQLRKTYAMFSEYYIPETELVPESIFREEVQCVCMDKTFMGIWEIFALSSVLNCKLFSMYPQIGSELYTSTLNRLVLPREDFNAEIGFIVWSSTRQDMKASQWIPNHFVPLVNAIAPALSDEPLFDDNNDTPIELDISGILSDLLDVEDELQIKRETEQSASDQRQPDSGESETDGDQTNQSVERPELPVEKPEPPPSEGPQQPEDKHLLETEQSASDQRQPDSGQSEPAGDHTNQSVERPELPVEKPEPPPSEGLQQPEDKHHQLYAVGQYVLTKHGKQNLPAVVVQAPDHMENIPEMGVWVQFYKKAGRRNLWTLEEKQFFLEFSNIEQIIEVPAMTLSGSRFFYKFNF